MATEKEFNNDWQAETVFFGDDFTATVETSGNEAAGEVPHVRAQFAVEDHLSSDDTVFTGEHRPASADAVHTPVENSREWASMGVNLVFTLAGTDAIVNSEFEAAADVVGESLPNGWDELES